MLTSYYNLFVMGGLEAVLLLGGLGLLYIWNLSNAAGNLQYFPGNITGFDLFPPTIYVTLIVQNTSNVTFTINSLASSVFSDTTLIGNVSDFIPVTIPGNSQGSIPLSVKLLPIGLANEIISIINGGGAVVQS